LNIFCFCLQNRVTLKVEWIPRSENVVADRYSKIFDFDDWCISDDIFHFFNKKWGPYDVDLFADCNNFKIRKFFSKYWTPDTSGVDAFAFNWKEFNSWIVPPVSLISNVIIHLQLCKASGTLIVPKWTSSHFWPMLVNSDGNFKYFVIDYVEYVKPTHFFKAGSHKESVFAGAKFLSNVLVLKVSFQ
jgi:hypothetical protein